MLVDVDDQPSLKDRFIHIEANPNCIPYSPYNTKQSSQSYQKLDFYSHFWLLLLVPGSIFSLPCCKPIFLDVLSLHLVSSRVVSPPPRKTSALPTTYNGATYASFRAPSALESTFSLRALLTSQPHLANSIMSPFFLIANYSIIVFLFERIKHRQ